MATPFDLFQQMAPDINSLDRFDQEAYRQQQQRMFADTFKDQLLNLKNQYEVSQMAAEDEAALNEATNTLNILNQQTPVLQNSFKQAESSFLTQQNNVLKEQNLMNSINTEYRSLKNLESSLTQQARNEQAKADAIFQKTLSAIPVSTSTTARMRENEARKRLANNRIYQQHLRNVNNNYTQAKAASTKANVLSSQSIAQQAKLATAQKNLQQAQQQFQVVNQQLNQHKQQVQTLGNEVQNFNQTMGNASAAANEAVAKANEIQQKIQSFQANSEPLKELQTKIEGDYETSAKASAEELKKLAENKFDVVTQRNLQNLLDQRAEQLAQTFGKNSEDVKKELSNTLQEPLENQFTREQFNQFMGIEAATQAQQPRLQETADLRQDVEPIAPVVQSQQPEALQTETPPVVQSQPVQPQPVAPQVQQAAQTQQSGMPTMPQAPAPVQNTAQPQQTGMPATPFGSISDPIKQGFQRQIQKGFQSAMKIKSTPAPKVDNRNAVIQQSLGMQTSGPKPVSQSKPRVASEDKGSNISTVQSQNTLTKNVGRRMIK
jgi:myosin heavy subunit